MKTVTVNGTIIYLNTFKQTKYVNKLQIVSTVLLPPNLYLILSQKCFTELQKLIETLNWQATRQTIYLLIHFQSIKLPFSAICCCGK